MPIQDFFSLPENGAVQLSVCLKWQKMCLVSLRKDKLAQEVQLESEEPISSIKAKFQMGKDIHL